MLESLNKQPKNCKNATYMFAHTALIAAFPTSHALP
jgi:hypothetical protein